MRYQFTDRAKICLDLANQIAQKLGHSTVDTGHMLLAIMRDSASKAYIVLESMGIQEYDIETELKTLRSPIGRFIEIVSYSDDMIKALDMAEKFAIESGREKISPENILRSILSSEDFPAYRIIKNLGFPHELIISEIGDSI